ncbi:MAG: universal stress protein [Rhodomicrobium sp.]
MSLRDIMVHLDSGPRTSERLTLAAALARRYDARLTGIFAQVARYSPAGEGGEARPLGAASRNQFEAAASGLRRSLWLDLDRGSDHEIVHGLTEAARHYDLAIFGQDDEDGPKIVPRELLEQVIVESGRPILVVPYAGHFPDIGQRPLIAWTEARAAARALNDSLPLLKPGAKVSVVTVGLATQAQELSSERISEHLHAHNIESHFEHMQVTEVGLIDTLLNLATDKDADLIVMGAFGGYGFPLFSRGSGTRYMLRHMTAPCLFSH